MALFDHTDWAAMRTYAQQPWSTKIVNTIQARVERGLAEGLNPPEQPGGWVHNYVCPTHWTPLIYDAQSPAVHRCPLGDERTGEVYDGAWRVLRHRQLADLARDAGLLANALDEERYADIASEILLDYAKLYTRFDGGAEAEPWMLRGRAFNQALTEALWAVPIIQAYDLVASNLSSTQNTAICNGLLHPMRKTFVSAHNVLIDQDRVDSNYTAWLLAAIGSLGFALNDDILIERAIHGRGGFLAHLDLAVRADGLEHEGALYYHNFVALAYGHLAEAARANGIDLYAIQGAQGQSIAAMWEALASLAYPDGSIPEASDGTPWQGGIFDTELCEVYETALARNPQPHYRWLLARAYERRGVPRDCWRSLLLMNDDIDDSTTPELTSTCLPASGLAVLHDTQRGQSLFSAYGPDGGSHTHHDRACLQIWPWSLDAGNPPYGIDARQTWYQHTLAHNTVVVDCASQTKAAPKQVECQDNVLKLASDELYPGVQLTRSMRMGDGAIHDETTLDSTEMHTYDWVMHADEPWIVEQGDLETVSGTLTPDAPGAYVELYAQTACQGSLRAHTELDGVTYELALNVDRPFQLLLATSPGRSQQPRHRRHTLLARCVSERARYRATFTVMKGEQTNG